jgi:hypothetical protein
LLGQKLACRTFFGRVSPAFAGRMRGATFFSLRLPSGDFVFVPGMAVAVLVAAGSVTMRKDRFAAALTAHRRVVMKYPRRGCGQQITGGNAQSNHPADVSSRDAHNPANRALYAIDMQQGDHILRRVRRQAPLASVPFQNGPAHWVQCLI